jgi:hypothetical protein
MVRQLLMYATGSIPHYGDRREINHILSQTKPCNHGLRSLIDSIVQSDLFLTK